MEHPRLRDSAPGPSALTALMLICAAVHALRWFALPMPEPPGSISMAALQRGEWWTSLTHIFTHNDIVHLGSNLLLLFLAGRPVQRAAGQQHAVYIFLLSAWAGAALSLTLRPTHAIIGVSGAAMGFAGACSALFPELNLLRPLRRWFNLQLRAKQIFPALLTAFLLLEILTVKGYLASNEAHLVHAGGLLSGWLYGRRLAAASDEESTDFFPQGLRRRRAEQQDHALLLAGLAKLPAQRQHTSAVPLPEPAPPVLSDAEFLAQHVDPVLEKLYSQGADKLTPEEKAVLDEAARRFPKRP